MTRKPSDSSEAGSGPAPCLAISATLLPAFRLAAHAALFLPLAALHGLHRDLLVAFQDSPAYKEASGDAVVTGIVDAFAAVHAGLLAFAVLVGVVFLFSLVGTLGLWMGSRCILLVGIILNITWAVLVFLLGAGAVGGSIAVPGLLAGSLGAKLEEGLGLALASRRFAELVEGRFGCCGAGSPEASYCRPVAAPEGDKLTGLLSKLNVTQPAVDIVEDTLHKLYPNASGNLTSGKIREIANEAISHFIQRAREHPGESPSDRIEKAVEHLCNSGFIPAANCQDADLKEKLPGYAQAASEGGLLKRLPRAAVPHAVLTGFMEENEGNLKVSTLLSHSLLTKIAFWQLTKADMDKAYIVRLHSLPSFRIQGDPTCKGVFDCRGAERGPAEGERDGGGRRQRRRRLPRPPLRPHLPRPLHLLPPQSPLLHRDLPRAGWEGALRPRQPRPGGPGQRLVHLQRHQGPRLLPPPALHRLWRPQSVFSSIQRGDCRCRRR